MAGFSTVTGEESIMFADNVSFDGTSRDGAITTNGELLIGSTIAPNIKVGTLTSPNSTISIGYSSPNITLDLVGGTEAIDSIAVQAGTSPVLPTAAGLVTINGSTVAAGSNPVRTNGTGPNTMSMEVQISQAIASTDATKIGLSNFNSSQFSVDANGFVSVSGTGVGQTITGNTGGALSPTAGNWNILGSHGINTSGTGSTLTAAIDNAITLGDLSAIAAGSNALSATTGDINISAGNIKVPNTNSSLNQGVIKWANGLRIHNFGASDNIFMGIASGNGTNTGSNNVFIGQNCGSALTSGSSNVAIGTNCLRNVTSGNFNVGMGIATLTTVSTSTANTCIGLNSGNLISTGNGRNTALGYQTLQKITTGSDNTAIGYQAGFSYTGTESNNIIIGSGNSGTVGENNVIRIGSSQTKCYIDGIDGVNVGSVARVVTEASDQLGTAILTAGTGISITPGANTITISNTSGGFPWSDVSGAFSPLAQNGYFITATASGSLPSGASQGNTIQFYVDHASQVLTLVADGTDIIRIGSSVSSAGGTAVSTQIGDSLELVFRDSDSQWCAVDVVGTWILS